LDKNLGKPELRIPPNSEVLIQGQTLVLTVTCNLECWLSEGFLETGSARHLLPHVKMQRQISGGADDCIALLTAM